MGSRPREREAQGALRGPLQEEGFVGAEVL